MRIVFLKKNHVFFVLLGCVLLFCLCFYGWQFFSRTVITQSIPAGVKPIYQGSSEKKEIALTCNIFWGEEYLPEMLKILEDNDTYMTFFIGGFWAEDHKDLTKEIYEKGHEIGNHGYSHPHPDRISREDNLNDIKKSEKILEEIIGEKTNLYAPPYGERGAAVLQAAEQAGYTTILWSIDTVDWKNPGSEVIANRVTEKAHNGAIVLMHPTSQTIEALPEIIRNLQEQGYSLVTISELLEDKDESYIKSEE